MRGRWLLLAVGVLAAVAVILVMNGPWMWVACVLLGLSWLVARYPDSVAPLGWLVWSIGCWILGGGQSLWGAAVVALAMGAVHLGAALSARTAPTGPAWIPTDWYRFAGFLAASALGLAVVAAAVALPALEGMIWVPAAVLLFTAVAVVLRLGVDRRAT